MDFAASRRTKNIEDCITTINNNCYKKIDSIIINNLFSFNVAGIGYDAFVAKYFSQEKKKEECLNICIYHFIY